MWLDDAEGMDPNSETGLASLMTALEEAENGHASPGAGAQSGNPAAPNMLPAQITPVRASGHSYQDGAPRLYCSVPWGLMLLREADPSHKVLSQNSAALAALDLRSELTVHVDWGSLPADMISYPVRLQVRQQGEVVASTVQNTTSHKKPLSIAFSVLDAAPGEFFVAELSWPGGARHLHMLAPLRAPVRLDGLTSPASKPLNGLSTDMPTPSVAILKEAASHADGPLAYLPDRGLGVELELITLAPDPSLSGCFTKAEELDAALRTIERKMERGKAYASTPDEDLDRRLMSILARCKLWTHEVDDHVMFSSSAIAARAAAEMRALSCQTSAELEERDRDRLDELRRLQLGGQGTMKSEFKSPSPNSGALNFARDGAAEISCFVKVLRELGAGASALSAGGCSGSSLHVHVNVANATAGGSRLSWKEILAVYFAWVRYDLVTTRFARPWMWREPSMAPLYATGTEFAWRETAWQQGTCTAACRATYDVPIFVKALRTVCHSENFEHLSEDEKLEILFGRDPSSPSGGIGRYCSLNLRRLTTYGTLEFRRFQGTLDDAIVVRWAHFCVAFVERFRRETTEVDRLLAAADADDALRLMAAEQEQATPAALMAMMTGFVSGNTADEFMRDSGAALSLHSPLVDVR